MIIRQEQVHEVPEEHNVPLVGGRCQNPLLDGSNGVCGKVVGAYPHSLAQVHSLKVVRDVLNQKIENKLKRGRYSSSAESARAANRAYPATVTHWTNFEANAADDTDDDNLEVAMTPSAYTIKVSKEVHSEENVRQRIFVDIAELLNCCSVGKMDVGDCGVISSNKSKNQRTTLGFSRFPISKMDVFCRDPDYYIFGMGVVKTFWSLNDMPVCGDEISRQYRLGSPKDENWRREIAKLYGYLIDQCCMYGFLTSYNNTWFCKVEENDSFSISNGIPCDFFVEEGAFLRTEGATNSMSSTSSSGLSNSRPRQPNSDSSSSSSNISGKKRSSEHIAEVLDYCNDGQRQNSYLRCMYHFMRIAKNNTIEFPQTTGIIRKDSVDIECKNDKVVEDNNSKHHCNDSPEVSSNTTDRKDNDNDGKAEGSTSEGDGVDSDRIDLNKSVFHFSRAIEVIGSGRRGIVFKYELESCDIHNERHCAVKVVDLEKTGNHEALHAELAAYKLLKDVQGVYIPRFLGVMVSKSGMRQGIALQLLDNSLSDDIGSWPEAQRQSAKRALLTLFKKFHIRHNDIRGANFGLDRVSGRVMVFDLEDINMNPASEKEAKKYLWSIKRELRL